MEIGIKIRKLVSISIRGVYRSACNHPFLVGFFGFLFLLYIYFPFLFSVLVSASPVLVCTAVLLGTLLSFGQPNLPELEQEEKVTHGISSFQTGFSEGETVVADRNESYFVRGYSEHRSDVEDSGIEDASLVGEKDNRDEEDCGLLSDSVIDDENLQDNQPEKQVKGEVERDFHSFELGKSREVHEENLTSEVASSDDEAIEKQYVLVQKEDDDFLNEKTPRDEGDVDGSPSSSWKHVKNNNDEDSSPISSWKHVKNSNDEDRDESVDSGSDKAESSSPDASMADIMPMLDELHPLLDLDAPQLAHLSRDGSDDASEKSQKSDDDSDESDEDIDNHGEAEEDGVDEEEEEMEGGKEDESKSAIKWTEDDQKNLIDLGTLELERNRRLENLIARRRARRVMNEKNLIDLDGADLPCNVSPISVRRNPFDFPDESYAAMGLPPIPGSAPSILQPRRNPFDIPYDPNEEKPDLKGDSFQQEFTQYTQKDAFFRRHESFSMGPSVLGLHKQERHDINWKPVFISERMASEGTSYFQRQSSEASDSKLSSVPDTESVSSAEQDERKFSEHNLSPENELTSNMDRVSDDVDHGSMSSGENDSVEIVQVQDSNVHHDEVEIVLGGVEDPSEMEFYPATEELEIHEQFHACETHLRREPSGEVSSSRSSQTSLSEVIDDIPDEKLEKTANLQQEDGHLPESRISTQDSVEESNFPNVSGEVEDSQLVEPVYDSSPPAEEKLISFNSVSTDSAMEFSDSALPPVLVETTADVVDKESEVQNHVLEDNSSGHEKNLAASSELRVDVKNELRSEKSEDIDQHNVLAEELSAAVPNSVGQSESTMAEFVTAPISVDSKFSPDIGSEKGVTDSGLVHGQDLANHVRAQSEMLHQDNVDSPDSNYQLASEKLHLSDNESVEEAALHNEVSRFDNVDMSVSVQDADEMLDSLASDAHSNSSSMRAAENLQLPQVAGQAPIITLPSEESEHIEKFSSNEECIFPIEQDKVLSNSMEQSNTNIQHELDKNIVSLTADNQHEIDAKSPSNLENHLSSSDRSVDAQSSGDDNESQNSDAIQVGPAQGFGGPSNDVVEELHDAIDETPVNMSCVTSEISDTPEFRSPTGDVDLEVHKHGGEFEYEDQNEAHQNLVPSAVGNMSPVTEGSMKGYMSPVTEGSINEFDAIKEIDEEFLSELDTVGDFSIGDAGASPHHTDIVHDETSNAQHSSLPENVKIAEIEHTDIVHDETRDAQPSSLPEDVKIAEVEHTDIVHEETRDAQLGSLPDNVKIAEVEHTDIVHEETRDAQLGSLPEDVKIAEVEHTDIVHEETRDAQLSSLPEDVKIAEVEQDIPALEARSLEDIDMAFKQLQEGVDVEEIILPSKIKDQLVSEQSKDHLDVNSDLQVIEARSLEDIDVALKQNSKDNQGELPKNFDSNDASVKIEANEVGSAKVSESFDVATSAEEMSRTPADKLENASISSSSDKEKSHSRKSSSSSSSSSSDSD